MEPEIYSVSQLNRYLKQRLDLDPVLSRITLAGGDRHLPPPSPFRPLLFYIEGRTGIGAVRHVPLRCASPSPSSQWKGMAVVAKGAVQIYEKEGALQVYVQEMQPDGLGRIVLWPLSS